MLDGCSVAVAATDELLHDDGGDDGAIGMSVCVAESLQDELVAGRYVSLGAGIGTYSLAITTLSHARLQESMLLSSDDDDDDDIASVCVCMCRYRGGNGGVCGGVENSSSVLLLLRGDLGFRDRSRMEPTCSACSLRSA